ncbi:MAG: protein-L-isoaspartate(D-aspartate) O-methyltransferase, partial [Polyangia bacterium]|nr:protein-L-isoaspartate(D-aspartate) O-methyltransferase [Polyangia bacterium]
MTDTGERHRREMVERQLVGRGVKDRLVLDAMMAVERHRFVPGVSLEEAYADHPLGIGWGQTISQPYMVARMTELLAPEPHHRILEIGAGSGYQTAILCRLCAHVFAVERIPELSERGRAILGDLGCGNYTWITGDGTLGLVAEAPFDGILVAAGSPRLPEPLLGQLAPGGRLVIPVGERGYQELQTVTLEAGGPRALPDT